MLYRHVCVLGVCAFECRYPWKLGENFESLGVDVTRVVNHPTWVLGPKF